MQITARKGDSCLYYSRLFNVPYRLLCDANGKGYGSLAEGERVVIPGYVIRKTERHGKSAVSALLSRHRLSPDALALVNPRGLHSENVIYWPQRVRKRLTEYKKEYDFATFSTDLRRLVSLYPFMKVETIGRTVLGRPIYEVLVGKGERHIHLNGAFHANEWLTSAVVMQFLNDYLLALVNGETMRGLLPANFYESVTLSLVPMVNPDGVDLVIHGSTAAGKERENVLAFNHYSENFHDWKANIRGVDLNNQFPANWKKEQARKPQKPRPRDFPGEKPLSEPEALAMQKLVQKRNFEKVIACHSQGKLIYWGFLGREPRRSAAIASEFSRVSGYEAVRNVDSYAGFKDWFIQKYRRPGFTIELGKGVNPLPLEQFDEIYQDTCGIFLAALYT